MKQSLILLITLLLATPMKDHYDTLWKQYKDHMSNSLPESAEKTLNAIEQKAEKDRNQIQLLKVILYRRQVMQETVEEKPDDAYLQYALAQLNRLDTPEQAILHEEIAALYADRVEDRRFEDCRFEELADQHYAEALQPVKALKEAKTEDYLCLFESTDDDHIQYEPTLFDFLFHRVAKHYREAASADDLLPEWDTQLWWLDDEAFVKAKLGDSDKPIIQCLKLFQQLIAENTGELRLYNDYKRLEFVQGILDNHDDYQKALRSLMVRHKDHQLFSDLSNCLATSLIRQYDENPNDSAYLNNYRRAADICRKAMLAYPKHCSACKSTLGHLTHPSFEFTLNQIQLPGENIPVVVEYRNAEHPYYKIVKVEESELDDLQRLRDEELYEALDAREAVVEQTLDLTAETDYLKHSTLVALPPLNEGLYYIIGKTDAALKIRPARMFNLYFQVSRLGYIIDNKPNSLTLVTVDRKTGHPLENVNVELTRRNYNYKTRKYETIRVASAKSDKNGRVTFTDKIGHDYFYITLRKGNDMLLPADQHHVDHNGRNTSRYDITTLFTDRAIYRPGQTLFFKGIAVHFENGQQALAANMKEHVDLLDANWQTVAQADFVTDEYGAFDGSFIIPNDLLNGTFRLRSQYGNTTVRVEEYKRPTFEIHFEGSDEQYKLNKDVTVKGSVDAYAGFGLDDIQYSYRVTRVTSFPWRCWWWWYPTIEDETIDFGEARTDESGRFAITFNLKPSLKTKPEQQPVFTYEIEVTATSAQGETHSDTYRIRAGYNALAIATTIPNLVEQSETDNYRIEVFNMNGKPAKSRVERKIFRFDEDARINYFEAFGLNGDIDRQVLSDSELQNLFPSYSFGSQADKRQHKTLVYQDEVDVNEQAAFYPGKNTLQPGRYYIELKSLDDPLAHSAKEFTVYQDKAKQTPYPTMGWYRTEKTTAQPGEKVRFTLGSTAKNVKMWVMLTHGDEVRLERWITLNDDVQTIEYTVTEADRGGLSLQTAFVKDNCYNVRSQAIDVPYNNYDLDVSLATVRDKLEPGGEETWTVKVKDYKDKPVEAALLAGMYDVSLDVFTPHYWHFDMTPSGVSSKAFRVDRSRFVSSSTPQSYLDIILLFPFDLPSDFPFFRVYSHRYYTFGAKAGARVLYRNAAVEEEAVLYDAVEMDEMAAPMAKEDGGDNSVSQPTPAPATQEEAEPTLRENFNETAFFFPNLRTEADGSSTFTFTMPDALTRWKLMMIAFTKDGKTGSKSYEFKASKPVMIMADMPRYMYDTDTLWLVANVINTGDEAVTPKAKLEIFDATTMAPVDLLLSSPVVNMKEIVPGRSHEVRWKVATRYDLGLLAFRFTAYAGHFSDAEQHLLPILSSEVFLTQTLPITVKAETKTTFDFDAIANPNSHERDYSLTLNFSTNPVWYAVQSLPSLANVKTDRPETAFYAFYANSLSAYIADHVPNLMAYKIGRASGRERV